MKLNTLFFITILCMLSCSPLHVESAIFAKGPVIPRLAKYLVEYFNLDKLEQVENAIESIQQYNENGKAAWSDFFSRNNSKCDTMSGIEDYFFSVYGSSDTNMTQQDIDNLIQYHVLRVRKSQNQDRRKKAWCRRSNCYNSKDVLKIADLDVVHRDNFKEAAMVMLYNLELEGCSIVKYGSSLSRALVWVIGLVFATIVTIWSWIGGLVLPFIHSAMYKKMLAGMIALACGVVLSNSLLKFVPMAVGNELINLGNPDHSFFLKHLLFIGVIFFFCNFERGMKLYAFYKKEKRDEEKAREEQQEQELEPRRGSTISLSKKDPVKEFNIGANDPKAIKLTAFSRNEPQTGRKPVLKKSPSIDIGEINIMGISSIDEITDRFYIPNSGNEFQRQDSNLSTNALAAAEAANADEKRQKICCTSLTKGMTKVRPIGWMAIFGDGLSNFIDGLSIGAAMNQGITSGLTVSISVWFGNIPQELGDFALLVRAGMTPFQALFYNYISALSCYIGFTVGCIAGQDISAARWIFAISGGTTLYIGLAVLLPEIVEEFEDTETFKGKIRITIIQWSGLMLGFLIMILLNMYEEQIEF